MDRSMLPYRDPRVDEMLEDPERYFVAASERSYTQARRIVEADVAQLMRERYPRPGSETNGAAE